MPMQFGCCSLGPNFAAESSLQERNGLSDRMQLHTPASSNACWLMAGLGLCAASLSDCCYLLRIDMLAHQGCSLAGQHLLQLCKPADAAQKQWQWAESQQLEVIQQVFCYAALREYAARQCTVFEPSCNGGHDGDAMSAAWSLYLPVWSSNWSAMGRGILRAVCILS